MKIKAAINPETASHHKHNVEQLAENTNVLEGLLKRSRKPSDKLLDEAMKK